MKRFLIAAMAVFGLAMGSLAQNVYWVFLTDKAGVEFDPYAYFDAKAIERYNQCGADLWDESNRPLRSDYVAAVMSVADEEVGQSRWLNAVGVVATSQQAMQIAELPCVKEVKMIGTSMQMAQADVEESDEQIDKNLDKMYEMADQLVRMQGERFVAKGIDGKGVRVAVLDGGFPRVNTHEAFSHLRESGRILKTWNFPNRKENVYGWNSHGTMTLSCVGGMMGEKRLGLATEAEYLLARTEVETEPFKEEIWWQMGMEWADRNGANIISSSLGYGKERYYTTDMDGTSYVARAGNMAARKGILVCNSAGNEATDRQWRTIITPSDADSVLCVGGINHSLTEYEHISFSSIGPSADGRLKPNVCAFGHALTAAVGNNSAYHYVDGTSFSCPLVAGFAACAWQASKGMTAMELFHAIERSADLYPYYDYAFGYGVPQASYFTGERKAQKPTFRFVTEGDSICVVPTEIVHNKALFFSTRRADGSLMAFGNSKVIYADSEKPIVFHKAMLHDVPNVPLGKLVVCLDGYVDSLQPTADDQVNYAESWGQLQVWGDCEVEDDMRWYIDKNKTSTLGSNSKYDFDVAFLFGLAVNTQSEELANNWWSPTCRVEFRWMRALCKSYKLGIGVGFGNSYFNYKGRPYNELEWALGSDVLATQMTDVEWRRVFAYNYTLELFQRVRLVAGGLLGKGVHWDLGVYGSFNQYEYDIYGEMMPGSASAARQVAYISPEKLGGYTFDYGVTTRINYDMIGIYGRYRLDKKRSGDVLLPRLEVGVQLLF